MAKLEKYNNHIIISLVTIILLIIILIFRPSCPWKSTFNIDCAGCGATRMILAIFNLDFYQAFRYNILLFSLIIFFIGYLIYIIINRILKHDYFKLNKNHLYLLLILVITFMILRNIPGFEFLKPIEI